MSQLNGRIYFIGGLYHIMGGFSHLPSFTQQLAPNLNPLSYDYDAVMPVIQDIRQEYEANTSEIDQYQAQGLMMANDIRNVENVLKDEQIRVQLEEEADFENSLKECRDSGVGILANHGVLFEAPDIYIVEQLPEPYTNAGFAVVTADQGDQAKHGIEPGIYFVREGLRPFYSKFLLLHELIHVALGERSPQMLGRGLEEGLAEILGSMYLSGHVLGEQITRNMFIYNRMSFGYSQFWELYLEYTRQAVLLYYEHGLDGMMDLLSQGRRAVKNIETKLSRGELADLEISRGTWGETLTRLVSFLVLAYPRSLVVTPLAKYLSRYVEPGKSVKEILSEAHVESEGGVKALRELNDRVYITLLRADDTVVSSSDCEFIAPGNTLRYELLQVE